MRIYVRLVERGTMSGAARDLDIGQPAVSERIEKLEKFLGAKLLIRSARTLICTEEGKIFYERSKSVIGNLEDTISLINTTGSVPGGSIRMATAQCFGEVVLPRVLMKIRESHPELNIDLVLNDNIVDPATEGVDISLRLGQLTEGAFVAYPLGYVRRALVAAPHYLERSGAIKHLADIPDHPFIRVKGIFPTDQLTLINELETPETIPIQTIMTTSHWRPMYEMIRAGAGIGVIQLPGCAHALADGSLVELLPQYSVPSFPLNLLTRTPKPYPLRVRRLIDLLRQHIPPALKEIEA